MTATKPPANGFAVDEFDQKTIALTTDFIRAAFDDARVLDGIPNGATLILLPEEDTAFIEESIQLGIEAIRQGRDVVFRHVGTSQDGSMSRDPSQQ